MRAEPTITAAAALLLGACGSPTPAPPPAALAGCYEVRFSRYASLTPAFALSVDSAPGSAVLRVQLDTVPARDAWESPAYLAHFPKFGSLPRAFWAPQAGGGMRITVAHVDDGNTMELAPSRGGGFVGTEDAWGVIEGGRQHARVAARRVSCDGFVPGYDAGARPAG